MAKFKPRSCASAKTEHKLINTDPADEKAVLANHRMAKAAWQIFTHMQDKLNSESQAFVAATGLAVRPKYGWTDVARFSALGIPAVNFGPGDPNKAHADDENVPVSQIYACESGLRSWLTA